MGGGGALGLAHVGVIEWFEEHHIPIDAISGASMGALVGGVYATGYDAAELKALVRRVEWNKILRGAPEYRNLQYRRKEDRRAFPNPLEFGLRRGVSTPSGISSGRGLVLLLNQLFLNVPASNDFDHLPTPFRCVATDLVSGNRVEFSDGSLAEALRASSAVPGYFVPVVRDRQVLVDGGMVDNLPVDSVKNMGADVVIASVLPLARLKADQVIGLGGVAGRAVSISILQNEKYSMAKATHLIQPAISEYSTTDYDKHEELMLAGYASADAKREELLQYALSDAEWAAFVKKRKEARYMKAPSFQAIEISGGSEAARKRLDQELTRELQKGPATPARIELALAREFGNMRYNWIAYNLAQQDGKDQLQVHLTEKRFAPPFLFFSPEIRGEDAGRTTLTLNSRAVVMDFTHPGTELRVDLSVGSRTLLGAEYYRRIGYRGLFVAPRTSYSRTSTNYYDQGFRSGELDITKGGIGLDVGYTTARFLEVRAGYDYGRMSATPRVGFQVPSENNGQYRSASIRVGYDGQDSAQVPSRGLRGAANLSYYLKAPLMEHAVPLASLDASYFHPVMRRDRVFATFGGGSSFGNRLPIPLQFTLGGPLRLGAFGIGQFRSDRMGYLTTGYLKRIGQLPPIFGGDLYLGGWVEGGMYQDGPAGFFKQSATTAFVAETPFGPIYAGWSLGRTDGRFKGKFSFLFGRFF
ncbi:patatin [Bryobacterales bacterium F-183]|nr:patatin [Bryobacterales bacterium F-183]